MEALCYWRCSIHCTLYFGVVIADVLVQWLNYIYSIYYILYSIYITFTERPVKMSWLLLRSNCPCEAICAARKFVQNSLEIFYKLLFFFFQSLPHSVSLSLSLFLPVSLHISLTFVLSLYFDPLFSPFSSISIYISPSLCVFFLYLSLSLSLSLSLPLTFSSLSISLLFH